MTRLTLLAGALLLMASTTRAATSEMTRLMPRKPRPAVELAFGAGAMSAGSGITGTAYSSTGVGLGGTLGIPVAWNGQLLAGLDLGISSWGAKGRTLVMGSSSIAAFHVLPTVFFRPFLHSGRWVQPYAGVSLGMSLLSERVEIGPGAGRRESLSLLGEVRFRPGLAFSLGKDISIQTEATLGFAGGSALMGAQARLALGLFPGRNSRSEN